MTGRAARSSDPWVPIQLAVAHGTAGGPDRSAGTLDRVHQHRCGLLPGCSVLPVGQLDELGGDGVWDDDSDALHR